MITIFNRLGPKLLLTTITFLLVLAIMTAFLVTQGFHQTQNDATQRSAEGLEIQGRDALLGITQREAQISNLQFQQAAVTIRHSAAYFVTSGSSGISTPWNTAQRMVRGPEGRWLDSNSNHQSSVFLSNKIDIHAALDRDIRESAALDALFPTLLEQNPDAVATYYVSPDGFGRYYPPIDLSQLLPADYPLDRDPAIVIGSPQANPTRDTVWTPPYVDPVSKGLLVSAITPAYANDQFRGITGIDVSLTRLIDHLNSIKPTPGGYAFLVDHEGHLIAAPPLALEDIVGPTLAPSTSITATLGLTLTNSSNTAFNQSIEAMRSGASRVDSVRLGDRQMFLAFAPVPNVGWSLGLVAPISEVTAQSAAVGAAIRQGTDDTVRSTLLTMGGFFLLALLGIALLSRRLTRPITALVAGTHAVATGDLNVTIPVTSRDELGLLARSFNQMIGELAAARQRLESWNQTLERTVEQRTAELAAATTEAQEARSAAENANRLKSRFLANMSHELRTPLNAILNFTHFIGDADYGMLTEQQQQFLGRVLYNAEHLLGLINDILDLSKIEAGKMTPTYEVVELSPLLHGVMATAAGLSKDKGLDLHLDIPEELPPVWIDKTRIRQVLLNLLSNAAKFTNQGSITVQVRKADETFVEIEVRDTGIGIAPEDQVRIFEEFQQVQGDLARGYQGTGLGLPISKRLIEMHGGQMWLQSTPGQGSTFTFTIPIAPAAHPATQDLADMLVPASTDGTLITVVDDDVDSQRILRHILEGAGYQVQSIVYSQEALTEIQRTRPALVILDLQMPPPDGWEVLEQIHRDPTLATLPVIICSVLDQEHAHVGILTNVTAHLSKPVRQEDILALLREFAPSATVLIVDDDADARHVLRNILERTGYRVCEAVDGAQALATLEQGLPNLMLLDLMMPGMDGFEVLEHMQTMPMALQVPVVVVTAKDLDAQELAWLRERTRHCMQKPVPSATFLAIVKNLVKGAVHATRSP